MPTTLLDKVRVALKRISPSAAQLADAVADARKADTDARTAVDKAASVVAAGFMDGDTKRATDRATLAAAREAAEDANLVLAEAERRHAAAVAADAEAARRVVYEGAKAQAAAAALALSKSYPALARGLVAMLKDLAIAQQAVAAANAQLPAGAVPLDDPEMTVRGTPGRSRETVSDEWVELWGRYDLVEPVEDRFQGEIYACGNGWGKRGEYERGLASQGEPQAIYRLRRFRKITYREPTPGDWPLPLAAAIQLPAVRGSGVLWGEAFPAYNPALTAALTGQAEPHNVLARVAEMEAAAVAKPAKAERPLKVEWAEFAEVVPLPRDPVTHDTARRGQPSGTGSRFSASPFQPAGARADGRR